MTRRLSFNVADAHYLANLCHNCWACLYACQYAPPHEFAVNLPRAMAKVRVHTYEEFAWPKPLGRLYRNNGLTVVLALAAGLALFLGLLLATRGTLLHEPRNGAFYSLFPHNELVLIFGAVFGWSLLALGMGAARFWRRQSPGPATAGARAEAIRDAATLRYLDGGHGDGCNDENDRFTLRRRRFHHLTFYGFTLCFAATCVATVYHYAFGWSAPYPMLSAPVLLGTVGGIGLVIGPAGLFWLNVRRHPAHREPAQDGMDRGFIALLFLTSITGLALLAARDSGFMGLWLALHLGCVMALFLTLPYGKFAHAVYRLAALFKYQIERRQPSKLRLGADA